MGEVRRVTGTATIGGDDSASRQHHVRAGETLSGIASRYGVEVAALLAANPRVRNPDRIFAGQTLVIPAPDARRGGPETTAQPDHYTVRPGDTLSAVAERRGIDLGRLRRANLQIRNVNLIHPGQRLNLPADARTQEQTRPRAVGRTNDTGGTPAPVEETRTRPARGGGGDDPNAILSRLEPAGASDATSRQDGLPRRGIHGVAASRAMAESDRGRVMRYRERIEEAARRYDLPPALLAAIASRESRGGAALDRNGEGDHGHGFGLMQVDNRNPFRVEREGGPFGQAHINQAASILRAKLDKVEQDLPNLSAEQQLFTAVSRYNGGAGRAFPNSDRGTTGGDYANDVIARAQYYASRESWEGGVRTETPGTRPGAPQGTRYDIAAPSLDAVRDGRKLLEEGMSGEAVRFVQRRLNIPADGDFGPRTRNAVEAFQRGHDLRPDGVVGHRTLAALERTERTGGAERPRGNGRVDYNGHRVTDPAVRAKLQEIADFFGRRVVLTSGDRARVVNGNNRSHHLRGRAADFHVEGISLGDAFRRLRAGGIIDRDYQVIHHTEVTVAPHLHIGHWGDGRASDFIVDTGQILPRRR